MRKQDLLDEFGKFHDRMVDMITEYVKKRGGKVSMCGREFVEYVCDSINTYKYHRLMIENDICIIDYECCFGDEGISDDAERVTDELWKFSANELCDIISDIKG